MTEVVAEFERESWPVFAGVMARGVLIGNGFGYVVGYGSGFERMGFCPRLGIWVV